MSLSINLIRNTERRSGSKVNLRTMSRIAAIAGPILVLTLILQQGLALFVLKTNLNTAETRWESLEPRQKYAKRQLARLNQNRNTLEEVEQWQATQPKWDAVLLALMQTTPEDIQIQNLTLKATPPPGHSAKTTPPVRRLEIRLEGNVREPQAMTSIQGFRDAIQESPLLADAIDRAEISNFAAASQSDDPRDRVFTIIVTLQTLGDTR